MKIERDLPVGILLIIVSLFPLLYIQSFTKTLWEFLAIFLCFKAYDLLFDFGWIKINGYDGTK